MFFFPIELKIEFVPAFSPMESEEYNGVLQILKNNWNIPSKFGFNAKQIREFISGEKCLSSGSGWWKYELCYGNDRRLKINLVQE